MVRRFSWQKGRIFLCTWHVKRAWLKNLLKHIKVGSDRLQMFDELCSLVHKSRSATGEEEGMGNVAASVESQIDAFCSKWGAKYPAFITYFKRTWVGKLPMLALAFRRGVITAGQTGTQILEAFHSVLKALLSGKRIRGRRLDWLLVHLLDTVHLKFKRR